MKLNLYLYKDNQLIYTIENQKYISINNIIKFTENNNTYEIEIYPNNFIFKKINEEGIFALNYLNKIYNYTLKSIDTPLNLPCSYQNYTYNNNSIIFEYQIASDEALNKIVLERMVE